MTRGLKVSVKPVLAEFLQGEPQGRCFTRLPEWGKHYSESQGLREESESPALVTARLWC